MSAKTDTRKIKTRETITVDKLSSSTKRLDIGFEVEVGDPKDHQIGDLVVVRTLTDNANYNRLELRSGRMARIKVHDVLLGVLGKRRALKGFVGDVPAKLQTGDKLHLLNLGGLIGRCSGRFHGLGRPIQVEFLGSVVRNGKPLNIQQAALEPHPENVDFPPLIVVAGTAMNSGKTQVITEVIKQFTRNGYKVSGAKLTGVAAQRDLLNMEDHGAVETLSFLDCGFPSTVGIDDIGPLTRTILYHLNKNNPDIVAIELGDGLLGDYNVANLFDHDDIRRACAAMILCAGNFVGALGGIHVLREKYMPVNIVSGPCTDSKMGVKFIKKQFALPSANAINDGERLFELVQTQIEQWRNG